MGVMDEGIMVDTWKPCVTAQSRKLILKWGGGISLVKRKRNKRKERKKK